MNKMQRLNNSLNVNKNITFPQSNEMWHKKTK